MTDRDRFLRAQKNLRELAARLFGELVAEGLTPSEAADVIVTDAGYLEGREELIKRCERIAPRVPPSSAKQAFDRKLLMFDPPGLTRTLDRATRIEFFRCRELERLASVPGATRIPTSMTETQRQSDPLWFLSEPLLPGPVARGMLASHRAYAMSAALDGLVHEPRWRMALIVASADLWMDEAKRYLALVASLPDANVPTSLIPASDRFDFSAAINNQRSLVASLTSAAA